MRVSSLFPLASVRTLALLTLGLTACDCGASEAPDTSLATTSADPELPGIHEVDQELTRELRALAAERAPASDAADDSALPPFVNRLVREPSPYLQQHAHDPVNWFPWGEEAFARARASERPIFLTIGYASCHWCHVMGRESYADEEIAALINEHFVPVAVDREERPDVDALYLTAAELLSGGGGWPMTLILAPSGDPLFAATYLPPRDVPDGPRGLLTVLQSALTHLRDDPEQVERFAAELRAEVLRAHAPPVPGEGPGRGHIRGAVEAARNLYDPAHGGFGSAPKFPEPNQLALFARQARAGVAPTVREDARMMLLGTLRGMASGGIHDQVGGGFHRYSTDAEWAIPHFEKMLADNAQLAQRYLDAYQLSGEERFAAVARGTLDYLARELRASDAGGGFFAAQDADSVAPEGERAEGYYYGWTRPELLEVLGPERLAALAALFSLPPEGDPRRVVLVERRAHEAAAAELALELAAYERLLADALLELRRARAARPAPARDRTVIAADNGLAIAAFARGALVLRDPELLDIARAAAEFALEHLREDGALRRRAVVRGAEPAVGHDAVLLDYAGLISGLITLFEVSGEQRWLDEALALQRAQDELFAAEDGGYWSTIDESLLARSIELLDDPLPSGNSLAFENLERLHAFTGESALRTKADGILARAGTFVRGAPRASPRLLAALDVRLDRPVEVVLAYRDAETAAPLFAVLATRYLPTMSLVHGTDTELAAIAERVPWASAKLAREAGATAYVCEAGRCELPTSDPEVFARQLAPFVEPPLPE